MKKLGVTLASLLIVGFLIGSISCGGEQTTPKPTLKPTPTATPIPTPTPTPVKVKTYSDGFDPQDGTKRAFSDENGSAFYENGKLHIRNYTISPSPSASFWSTEFTDFTAEIEMEFVGGSNDNWQGFLCRYNLGVGDYYFLGISADGYYMIEKFEAGDGGVSTSLSRPSTSSHILTGLGITNTVRVECIGNSLTLYVNGFSLAQVTDSTFSTGIVGFGVTSLSGEYSEVAFDNLVITTSYKD
jgi:hypothetical protein